MNRPSPKALADAREIIRQDKRARKAERPARTFQQRIKPKGGHVSDNPFKRWLHEIGLGCIACAIEGPPSAAMLQGEPNPMEVAHQRIGGWKKGVRGDDKNSCILCRWHHQLAPNACDKGQAKFWGRLAVDVAAYCAALYSAFQSGEDGASVLRRFTLSKEPAA